MMTDEQSKELAKVDVLDQLKVVRMETFLDPQYEDDPSDALIYARMIEFLAGLIRLECQGD